jgi:CRP/FNR family transcriptional regulator, cyclic AMP receptor protein
VAVDGARLKPLPLFAGLSDRQRARVARHCHAVVVPQGEHLLDEGYSAYEFFVIEEGRAAVVSSGKHLRDLGPGDFLGEIGILSEKGRTASVIATSTVKAIAMSANDFREMTDSIPEVAKQINEAVEDRLERDRLFGLDR